MFAIGDLVVHPMHGAGVIADVVREKIAGSTQEYYVFRMPVGGLVLKIPTGSVGMVGLRPVVDGADALRLLEEIPAMEAEECGNWNKRYRDNLLRIKSGDLRQVARVVKGLMERERRRGLSTGERKMLRGARQILLSELTLALDMPYEQVESRVDGAMARLPAGERG